MGTTKPSKRILESCDEKAIELINLIKHNSHYDFLDKKYKELLGAKRPLFHNALFMDANTLIDTIKTAENTDVDEEDMKFQIERINLATFAYNVLREEKEFNTCLNTYFRSILPYFDEFTGEEILLYLAMRLFRLRLQFNDAKQKADADAQRRQLTDTERLKLIDTKRRQLINECFPKLRKNYYFLGNKKGEDQIMNAVEAILRFFRSISPKDLGGIGFGGRALFNTFLRSFIEYRMEHIGSEYREGSEIYPTSIEELRELVENLFKSSVATAAFNKEEDLEEERYNNKTNIYDEQSEENSDSEQSEENSDSEQSEENSDSDDEKLEEDIVEVHNNDEASTKNSDNGSTKVHNSKEFDNIESDDNDKSSDKESFHSAADEDIFHVEVQLNTDSEEDELVDYESDNETEKPKSIQTVTTKAARHIVDEQPNAHALTAEEADFSDNEPPRNKYLVIPGLHDDDDDNDDDDDDEVNQISSQARRSPSASLGAHSNRLLPSNSSRNDNPNVSNNQGESSSSSTIRNRKYPARPLSDSEDSETSIPDGYYKDETTNKRRKIPKTREKALFWTPNEVQALEDGLKQFKKRCWVQILNEYKSRLGNHTQSQLKDKARNEIIRRKKANLPLGGFYYVENPIP